MTKKYRHLRLPFTLMLIVIGALCFGRYIPYSVKQMSYTASLAIKELLIFILPALIFSLLFSSIIKLSQGAFKFVILLVSIICISNYTSTTLAYLIGNLVFIYGELNISIVEPGTTLAPLYSLNLPKLISNERAILAAAIVGIVFNLPQLRASGIELGNKLSKTAESFLRKYFIPLLPIFILGFVLKMESEGILSTLVYNYSLVLLLIIVCQLLYVGLLYGVATKFHKTHWPQSMANMLPAIITAFSTMSSVAAMPLSLEASQKNTGGSTIGKITIPMTVNVHLIGDCIAIPMFAFAIANSFGLPMPTFAEYFQFTISLVIAKFAVAAVPGGGIIVMLPIIEQYLGFDSVMLSMITALYILFDCVTTSVNVLGNGAFNMLIVKYCRKLQFSFAKESGKQVPVNRGLIA